MPKINLNLSELTAEKADLDTFLARPDAYADPDFSKKNKRLIELQTISFWKNPFSIAGTTPPKESMRSK